MPSHLLALNQFAVGALLTAFLALAAFAWGVVRDVQARRERIRERTEDDLRNCLEEKQLLEAQAIVTDRKYIRLLRERDDLENR